MWSNNKQSDSPNASPAQPAAYQPPQAPATYGAGSAPAPTSFRSSAPTARNLATLGPGLTVKGQISGDEDLQIEGKVEGPISLKGQRLTVGSYRRNCFRCACARSDRLWQSPRQPVAEDRVEVKKDGSVVGNITGGRVLIEDGAYLKGQIEIERGKSNKHASAELEPVGLESAATRTRLNSLPRPQTDSIDRPWRSGL